MEPSPSGSPWDRRVVRAMTSAESARQGATILRVVAAITAAVGIIGPVLYLTASGGDGNPARIVWGQILQVTALPIAGAGVVLAFSFLVELYASRLDLDIVLADDDQTGGVDEPGTPSELPPPFPTR